MAREGGAGEEAVAVAGGADAAGGEGDLPPSREHAAVDGGVALREWFAPDGVCAAAGKGSRFRLRAHHGARRQGRERSSDDAAGEPGRAAGVAPGSGARAA